jgi:hypothetical protein
MQVDESAAKKAGNLAIDRLEELAIQARRVQARGILLHADDRAGRPELVLGVIVAAVEEWDVLPYL